MNFVRYWIKRFQFDNQLSDGEIRLKYDFSTTVRTDGCRSDFFDIQRVRDGRIIGRCDLRYGMDEDLFYSGHIGYSVYGPYRGQHYAQKACGLLFRYARAQGETVLWITCNPDNYPSVKTCEHLGADRIALVKIPPSHGLYRQGDRMKYIYEVRLDQPAKM